MAQVYMITNKINNKKYVGITKYTFEVRYYASVWYKCHSMNRILKQSIKKHGPDNFEITILEEPNVEKLGEREVFYIEKYKSLAPHGYNLTKGGEINVIFSEETKLKISLAKKGKPSHNKGKKHSKEQIEKFIKSRSGIPAWNKGLTTGPMSKIAIENSAKAHRKQVNCYKDGILVKTYESVKQTAEDGFHPYSVSKVCRNKAPQHKKHQFSFVKENK